MSPTELEALRRKLERAALAYDNRRINRPGYNRYALGQYLTRIDEACAIIAKGTPVSTALAHCFNDRLLTALQKAAGVA
jgi:hypothetical protein